ncbi:hypothetical protein F5146DRAFT_995073 [Armillaria mellea]|nr:hypothetical protein F5146DRAFT_995073 [Armillaria mellea]
MCLPASAAISRANLLTHHQRITPKMRHSDTGITADTVRGDLMLLTKLAQPDKSIQGWDRLCSAVVNDHIFITSPNCPLLFNLPLGVNRKMWMRNDFRYGEDDPLSWPQPYCASHPHLPCLRLCFWTADHQSVFEDRCRLILGKCVTIPIGDDKSAVGANHAEELQTDSALFLDQLKSMPMTFHRLCLSVTETQRLVLEVQAIWAYFSTIQPRFTALDGTSSMCKVDMDLVGCFTTNVRVTQQLHGAGVPVWVLCPLDDLVHTRIDKVMAITTMDGRVHLGPCPLHLCSVFVGSGTQEGKYKVFDQFTRSQFGAPNVFAWTLGQLRSELTTSRVRKNMPAEGVFAPYNQAGCSRKGNLKPGPANRYEVITHELLPAIRQLWQEALLCVNAEKAGLHVPAAPFAFPHPDLFVTISDSAKHRSMLSTWLHLRPGHVAIQTSSYSPVKLSHQMW